MSKDQDNFTPEEDYSLEDILAEFSEHPGREETATPLPADSRGEKEAFSEEGPDLPWPEVPRRSHKKLDFPAPPPPETEEVEEAEEPETPHPKGEKKVLEFPGAHTQEEPETEEETPFLEDRLEQLKRKADAFADQMFAEEGTEVSEQTMRLERLIPGVDREEEPDREAPSRRERKPRPAPKPLPDRPPEELYRAYSKGLGLLRLRWLLVTLLCLPQLFLLVMHLLPLSLPPELTGSYPLQVYLSTGLLLLAALLGLDAWGMGIVRLFRGRPGMDTLLAFALLFTVADALTMQTVAPRGEQLPYCGVVTFALAFALRGNYLKRRGLRLTCRVAASVQEPYVVTLDEAKWNGRPTYAKHLGTVQGFGSQIQADDGAQRMFRLAVPVIMLACMLFALLASVGKGRPEALLWCLSALFTASASFGGLLGYSKPFAGLAKRLSASGAALAGWEGVQETGKGIILTDTDLFPPGTVTLNGIKVFGDFPIEKVVAVTATLIRQADSGLDRIFRDLLRSQGGSYRRCEDFSCYEGGGLSATIRDQQIYVGTAAFMALMEVRLPQGLNVKNAVFCAIDGELAGIFALNYTLHGAISPALYALIQNKISPVLATRDFNIIPAMLRQRFKLPVEKMEYPPVERRMELSDWEDVHSPVITALLCREGLAPYAEAVVGAQRLRRATVLSSALTCLGSGVGVLLAFYLTVNLAYSSLSAINLLVFLLMWVVPTYLISGWVNKY